MSAISGPNRVEAEKLSARLDAILAESLAAYDRSAQQTLERALALVSNFKFSARTLYLPTAFDTREFYPDQIPIESQDRPGSGRSPSLIMTQLFVQCLTYNRPSTTLYVHTGTHPQEISRTGHFTPQSDPLLTQLSTFVSEAATSPIAFQTVRVFVELGLGFHQRLHILPFMLIEIL